MTVARAIAKNVSVQIVGRVIGTIFGLITIALITRYLGPAGYGDFTTATSYLQFVGVLVDFGLTLTAVQMLSEPDADEPRLLGNLVSLRVLSALVMFAIAPMVALAIPWSPAVHQAIWVGAISFVLLALHQMFVALFQRTMRMELSALAEVLGRGALLAATMIVISMHGGLGAVIATLAAGNLVMAAVSLGLAQRLRPFRLRFERAIITRIVRRSWPMALSIFFNLIYLRGDMIILSLTRSATEVGLYGAAYKPLDVITVFPMMFMGLVLPLLVHAWSSADRERTARLIRRATDAVSLLAFPIAAGGIALATPTIVWLAGEKFAGAGPLLALLTVAAGCVFFGSLFGHIIVGIGKQRSMLPIYAADAVASLGLYLWLIPHYGATAAALVTIFSELVIAVGAGIMVARATGVRMSLRVPSRALAAAVLMGLAVAFLPGVHVLIRIVIGAALYGALLIAFGALSREDVNVILQRKPV
jgi:O-antigen/teichoic acid export membrane protein